MTSQSKSGKKAHRWTSDELEHLAQVVRDSEALRDHYQRQNYALSVYWDAVAGIMYRDLGLLVTGKACRRQWDFIRERMALGQKQRRQEAIDLQGVLEAFSKRLAQLEQALAKAGGAKHA